ncbi:MAG TPA: lipoxygenase family protein [Gaiellaceae bacterium]|jgi:hypothetical protein
MTGTGTPPTPPPPQPVLIPLPLQEWGFYNCPAVPYWALPVGPFHIPDLALAAELGQQLGERGNDPTVTKAYAGLTEKYSIGPFTGKNAHQYLYGCEPGGTTDPSNELCLVPLDHANQFTLPWTNDGNVFKDSTYLREPFAKTLTDPQVATREFWPTIANFGIPYNLILLARITKRAGELKKEFGQVWADEGMDAAVKAGLAYVIDTRIIETVEPYEPLVNGVRLPPRFAPGAITLLKQNAKTKDLEPVAVKLFTAGTSDQTRIYKQYDSAWIYALQAAKASLTTWGIWLGHVGHWHIPTAAMWMTMQSTLLSTHPLRTFLDPISDNLIDFDFVLTQLPGFYEGISPPTPVAGPMRLLELLDRYLAGKTFFDLDPLTELSNQGIDASNFTTDEKHSWNKYPLAGFLVDLWQTCESFATVVADQLYTTDGAVEADTELQAWIEASKDPSIGNVKLPDITTQAALRQLLTSLLYRVTAHAAGSLTSVVNPALAFMSNFPPCLQRTDMPDPLDGPTDSDLLGYLPFTGTMGTMATFYFTFAYTPADTPAIPGGGVNLDPYWTGPGPVDNACNAALFQYRTDIVNFVKVYTDNWNEELVRIGGRHGGGIPGYAKPADQLEQWPRSIEI